MNVALLVLSLVVACGGFYAVKRAQPPALVRVRGVAGRAGES